MNKLRAFSKSSHKDTDSIHSNDESTSPTTTTGSPSHPRRIVTAESKGELSPALSPVVTLLSAQAHRTYNEGVFMLLKDLDSEGNTHGILCR